PGPRGVPLPCRGARPGPTGPPPPPPRLPPPPHGPPLLPPPPQGPPLLLFHAILHLAGGLALAHCRFRFHAALHICDGSNPCNQAATQYCRPAETSNHGGNNRIGGP